MQSFNMVTVFGIRMVRELPYSIDPWSCQDRTALGPAALASSARGSLVRTSVWGGWRRGRALAAEGTDRWARTADHHSLAVRQKQV